MALNNRLLLFFGLIFFAAISVGCNPGPKVAQISGAVTFKGKPVPAGYITFTPDVATGTLGQVVGFQIKDGKYDSKVNVPPGLPPGSYKVRIGGFDGVKIPMWGQGKQIFNPIEDYCTVPESSSTKDFEIPDSARQNLKIEPTADT